MWVRGFLPAVGVSLGDFVLSRFFSLGLFATNLGVAAILTRQGFSWERLFQYNVYGMAFTLGVYALLTLLERSYPTRVSGGLVSRLFFRQDPNGSNPNNINAGLPGSEGRRGEQAPRVNIEEAHNQGGGLVDNQGEINPENRGGVDENQAQGSYHNLRVSLSLKKPLSLLFDRQSAVTAFLYGFVIPGLSLLLSHYSLTPYLLSFLAEQSVPVCTGAELPTTSFQGFTCSVSLSPSKWLSCSFLALDSIQPVDACCAPTFELNLSAAVQADSTCYVKVK